MQRHHYTNPNSNGDDDDPNNQRRPWFDPFGWSGSTKEASSSGGGRSDISPRTLVHLRRVYGNLTVTSALAAFANILYQNRMLFEPGVLVMILSMMSLFAIRLVPIQQENVRRGLLYGFGFLNGWSIAPLIFMLGFAQPGVVQAALISTMLIFGSFTASALYAPRRSFLYLGGVLIAVTLILLFMGFVQLFLGSGSALASAAWTAELYLGLFLFSAYVAFDTQAMIERSEASSEYSSDSVQPAADLFTNVVQIFVRMLIIMSRNREEEDRKSSSRRRRRE